MKTLHQKYTKIQEIGLEVEIPWKVWRVLGADENKAKIIEIAGHYVSLGSDFVSLEEAQVAVAWYVTQLGGTVTWDKK